MRENFSAALANLFEWEGISDNDPDDPGGETHFGLSRTFNPEVEPWPPTKEQAAEVYLKKYWAPNGCDVLPFPVDVLHFDSCVNPGPGAAVTFLHDSGEHADPYRRAVDYIDQRMRYYLRVVRKRPTSLKYICGWMDRSLDFLERTVLTHWSLDTIP